MSKQFQAQYLIRMDDACPSDKKEIWDRLEKVLDQFHIQPIVAVIPNCEDETLRIRTCDENFWERIRRYQEKGYSGMNDNTILQKFHFQEHTEVLTSILTQPTEDIILARNAELRKNPGVINDLGKGSEGGTWGRQLASIPEIMFYSAIGKGFDLLSKDKDIAAKEMQRFLATPDGQLCLVQGK